MSDKKEMTAEWIEDRIKEEFKKHPDLDWAKIASLKIKSTIIEIIQQEREKAFNAAREKEYHYSKSGIDTGYYEKYESFSDYQHNNPLI